MTCATYASTMKDIMQAYHDKSIDGEERERQIKILNSEFRESAQTDLFDDPEYGAPPPEAFQ